MSSQEGIITVALKDILDKLNELPLYGRTISAQAFITDLERVCRARISRHQQDAQEFLQAIIEKLNDELLTARKARQSLEKSFQELAKIESDKITETLRDGCKKAHDVDLTINETLSEAWGIKTSLQNSFSQNFCATAEDDDSMETFPFEGQLESQIECLSCHFQPKPTISTFVTLTLSVPNSNSTSLNSCFDNLTKIENIDDFRCEACRLNHALTLKEKALLSTGNSSSKVSLHTDITMIRNALETDPEKVPNQAHLPPICDAPKRRIARYTRISRFPRVLAIHLSRSVFNMAVSATKNMAQVSFPENLSLGGLLSRTNYALCAIVTHKGGHNSGHYESFRHQNTSANALSASLDCDTIKANSPVYEQKLYPALKESFIDHENSRNEVSNPYLFLSWARISIYIL